MPVNSKLKKLPAEKIVPVATHHGKKFAPVRVPMILAKSDFFLALDLLKLRAN